MAILNFQKPDKVIMIESSDHEGRFEFRPLEPGYGLTVGNALRRVLLSSLEGFAITSVKIEGVDHEFSTIPGIVEDVTEIVLNLKQIRFKRQIEDVDNELVSISIIVSSSVPELLNINLALWVSVVTNSSFKITETDVSKVSAKLEKEEVKPRFNIFTLTSV